MIFKKNIKIINILQHILSKSKKFFFIVIKDDKIHYMSFCGY